MKTKKKLLIPIAAILILIVIAAALYFSPKTFGKNVDASEVDHIIVFDGNKGVGFTVDNPVYIAMIVRNLQNTPMKRDGISIGSMGYRFSIEGVDGDGKTIIPILFINSDTTIRKDPFFYTCDGGLCIDFLEELEAQIANTENDNSAPTDERIKICIDKVYYVNTGIEVPVEPDESVIEYVEIPVGGETTIKAFARMQEGNDTYLVCLIGNEWYKFIAE